MQDNDLIYFLKSYIYLFVAFVCIVFIWSYVYVIPATDWNNTIMNCQLDIDDMSYEGYEYCVSLHSTP